MQLEEILKPLFRDVPDFPKSGIIFKDITPLLANASARTSVVKSMASHFAEQQIEAVAAVEARGFIFGSLLANELNVPFIPVRKAGKLPYKKLSEEYSLEYGSASIEMHEDAISRNQRVLIHDDLLATGGTATAAGNLVRKLGGLVAGYSFVINLSFLPGEQLLKERFHVQPHYLMKF
jgi:adenine phosphoribosyltransferase